MTMRELIEKAKDCVVKNYDNRPRPFIRPWLEASPPDSYGDPSYRMSLCVFEGSPAKGWVVVNHSLRQAWAFDGWGNKIGTFSWFDDIEKREKFDKSVVIINV
jgi:hypothetical protein